ncbi:CHAT domain-containing tetratricopeptide repeat protein [Sphingosinicella sp. CPCC 101087]|uniref:CHAT domain-containing protein n=1 Tax=Sphingosinicella sp. CPCC 101087 TaxID=2497754 RepID=UPI00101E174E|nr:CHAT domain-containing tetratricopeptide repeat protein [Sphingosinicella sp. CPCC 101087]
MDSTKPRYLGLAALLIAGLTSQAPAAAQPLSYRDSFRIGSGSGVLCTAQAMLADPALTNMFDRGYSIVCRDASAPVGQIYALRSRDDDPLGRLAAIRAERAACDTGAPAELPGLGAVETLSCRLAAADIAYVAYVKRAGDTVYVAEGLGGYDSALRLGLRSVVEEREVEGEVSVATTGAGDPAAFARAQAGTLDPQRALAEAYRRNNAGSYAEAAEFFGQITSRDESLTARAEALANEALQKSNLGRYAEAETLFARASEVAGTEPVTARRLRNYRAMHLLNQGLAEQALAELDRPLPTLAAVEQVRELVIDPGTAAQLTAESPGSRQLGGIEGLTPQDKARILDGQALQLRGTVMRLLGRDAEAIGPLTAALDQLVAIREGRIAATMWMRAQILAELASIAEARGDQTEAERLHRAAVDLLEIDYPGSPALLSAQGRLAGFHARTGRTEEATALFRQIVAAVAQGGDSSPTLRRLLAPYFALLAERGDDPAAVADLFAASQVLVRPGVAQTQAILARELSGGSDEAARLFRQSVTLTREIERARIELARIEADEARTPADAERAAALRQSAERMQQDQLVTQARLAEFPRYRVVASNAITLADVQALLRSGEAYYKLMALDDAAYGMFVTPESARAFRLGASPAELESQVDALRATISLVENNQQLTYPFDVALAHQLYRELFAPVDAAMAGVTHLVFEPDGALLRLPPNLLVMDRAGVEAYQARAADPASDGFDFRGIEWLGRRRDVSTAVSARAFRDVRQAPASRASADYLGFGQNDPVGQAYGAPTGTRGAGAQDGCAWPLLAWNRPISAAELFTARSAIASTRGSGGEVVTGEAFTDTRIVQRQDLDEFRILHFATHGLVSGPRPECPAQPALLTSFGGEGSDGLLTFAEIFDLRLDADLVILSACDTAGHGGRAAAEAAGISTGGEFALDGLVRAFVGAGGRIVVASHWPVPDDFDATQRLISGLFQAPPGTGTATALRMAQLGLMDQAETSHPYYWSGFAVVGDGTAPVVPAAPTRTAGVN